MLCMSAVQVQVLLTLKKNYLVYLAVFASDLCVFFFKVKEEYIEFRKMVNDDPIWETAEETQMYRLVFWTLWEKARVG